jgi:hypothetical protein
MAGTTGLEPATSAVTGQRSNQLSYVPLCFHTLAVNLTIYWLSLLSTLPNHETVTISLLNCSKESPVDRLQRLIRPMRCPVHSPLHPRPGTSHWKERGI